MRITGKFMDGDNLLGFQLTDNAPYSVSPKALYIAVNIQELTKEGYIYQDYDPSHIKKPNGDSIMTVPTLELDATVRQELLMSNRMAAGTALSDAQASKYYTMPDGANSGTVSFKVWDGGWLINTREELEVFVNQLEARMIHNPCAVLVRPLNTLVNPDVWFTPEEVYGEARGLYARILRLRKWGNFEHFKLTCKFFEEQGLMQEGDYTLRSLIKAWFAYGPDLIKGQYTSCSINYNVDGIFAENDALISPKYGSSSRYTNASANRIQELGAYDTQTGDLVTFSGQKLNVDSFVSLTRGPRQVLHLEDRILNKLKSSNTNDRLILVPTVDVRDMSDRFYCNVYSDGRTYEFKADSTLTMVKYGSIPALFNSDMLIGTAVRGFYIPLKNIASEDFYKKVLIAQMHAIINSKRTTIEPISRYNNEYFDKINVGLIGAIRKYCANKSMNDIMLDCTSDWKDYDFLADALQFYCEPVPAYVLDAFGLSECESKKEFLEKADVDKYVMKLNPEEGDIEGDRPITCIPDSVKAKDRRAYLNQLRSRGIEHEPYHYYRFIETVQNVIEGKESYGCLQEGGSEDAKLKMDTATYALCAIGNAAVGVDATVEEFAEALTNIDQYINPRLIYRLRTKAATGYVLDFAKDAELMWGMDTRYWIYISRVYRELSNKPVEQQRPYLLEVITLGNKEGTMDAKYRDTFTKIVEYAMEGISIVPDYDYEQYFYTLDGTITNAEEVSKKFAPYLAAQLFFKTLLCTKNGKIPVEHDHIENVTIFEGKTLSIRVPAAILQSIKNFDVEVRRKFITLEYLSNWEINGFSNGGNGQFACVNAYITPWSVSPLPGYSIKSYPLMHNYYEPETLNNALGSTKTNALVANKVKVHNSLKDVTKKKGICYPAPPSINPKEKDPFFIEQDKNDVEMYNIAISGSDYHDFDAFLVPSQNETVEIYVKRWNCAKAEAKRKGMNLLSIPLKQDVMFAEIGEALGYEITVDPVYTEDDSVKANFLAEDILPLQARNKIAIEEQTRSVLRPLGISNIDEDIAKNFINYIDLPILDATERYGAIVYNGKYVSHDWAKENFAQVNERKCIGRLQSGFYVLEEV